MNAQTSDTHHAAILGTIYVVSGQGRGRTYTSRSNEVRQPGQVKVVQWFDFNLVPPNVSEVVNRQSTQRQIRLSQWACQMSRCYSGELCRGVGRCFRSGVLAQARNMKRFQHCLSDLRGDNTALAIFQMPLNIKLDFSLSTCAFVVFIACPL